MFKRQKGRRSCSLYSQLHRSALPSLLPSFLYSTRQPRHALPPTDVNAALDIAGHPDRSTRSQPRLRRLASKPLKLAASTFKPRSSRAPSPFLPDDPSSTTISTAASSASGGWKKGTRHQHISHQTAAGLTPAQVASAARGPRKPLEGEEPAAWLRVRVVKAEGLVAKDRSGTSDP